MRKPALADSAGDCGQNEGRFVSHDTLPSADSILPACAHHWDIETTPGKFSPGKCRLCGEVKDDFRNGFANDYEEYNEARKLMRTAPRSEPANVTGEPTHNKHTLAGGGR